MLIFNALRNTSLAAPREGSRQFREIVLHRLLRQPPVVIAGIENKRREITASRRCWSISKLFCGEAGKLPSQFVEIGAEVYGKA